MTVLIAGAGLAGLSLGLTLHQIGVPFRIYESVDELKPLGVGINLQPNAVRELFDLGLAEDLDAVGVRTEEVGFFTRKGLEIWAEPRGTWAGYTWPQFSIHRGALQMLLYRTLVSRAGAACIVAGAAATGYRRTGDGVELALADGRLVPGDLLIAADGIHSAIRGADVSGRGRADLGRRGPVAGHNPGAALSHRRVDDFGRA